MVSVAAIAAVLTACTSGTMTSQRAACDHAGRDSVFAVGGPVYRECAVDHAAKLLTSDIHPEFRPASPRPQCYSADVEFVVDSMGKPEQATARVVKANDDEFATSVLSVLTRWKYDPATLDGRRVRQIVKVHQSATIVRVVVSGAVPSGPPRVPAPGC
jgi:hypothetical protein